MRDIVSLVDAICDAYDNPALVPLEDGTTFCNVAVSAIGEAMGCSELAGRTADQIVEYLRHSMDWETVAFEDAQNIANQGAFVLAAATAAELGQTHGHVVVIRPGKPCYSGKWGDKTPRCLNIGKENFLARAKRGPLTGQAAGLNQAFKEKPNIWVWKKSR